MSHFPPTSTPNQSGWTSQTGLQPGTDANDRRQSTGDMSTDVLSETESDASSVMGDTTSVDLATSSSKPATSPATREELQKRIDSLTQEIKVELETYRLREKAWASQIKSLQEENRALRQASVTIQAKAEQEEEFISNTLLKKIEELKKEKEALALNYEQEEECLTNDLSRKLNQLRTEKAQLATTLAQEQESLINRLMKRIQKLEADTQTKQQNLEQLRREKVQLENTLEQEQEALVNRLYKRMEKLEAEKRSLQTRLEQNSIPAPPSPMDTSEPPVPHQPHAASLATTPKVMKIVNPGGTTSSVDVGAGDGGIGRPIVGVRRVGSTGGGGGGGPDSTALFRQFQSLREEVVRLKQQLKKEEVQHSETITQIAKDEKSIREENLRLRRKLEMELERRLELCRHLSESESSLEMEDERHFNELSMQRQIPPPPASAATQAPTAKTSVGCTPPSGAPRARTISSPVGLQPAVSQSAVAPVSVGGRMSPAFGGLNVNVNLGSSSSSLSGGLPLNSGYPGPPSPLLRCNTCGTSLPSPQLMSGGAVLPAHHHSPSSSWGAAVLSNYTSPAAVMGTGTSSYMHLQQQLCRTHSSERGIPITQSSPSNSGSVSNTSSLEKFVKPTNPPMPKASSPALSANQNAPSVASTNQESSTSAATPGGEQKQQQNEEENSTANKAS